MPREQPRCQFGRLFFSGGSEGLHDAEEFRSPAGSFSLLTFNCGPSTSVSLPRPIRRPPHMQVAQIMQRRLVILVHSTRVIRVAQSPVARGFRHILPYAEFLLKYFLAFPRDL